MKAVMVKNQEKEETMKGWETKVKDGAIIVKAKIAGYYRHNHIERGIEECTKHYVIKCPYCGYYCHVPVRQHIPVDVCQHFDGIHIDRNILYGVHTEKIKGHGFHG